MHRLIRLSALCFFSLAVLSSSGAIGCGNKKDADNPSKAKPEGSGDPEGKDGTSDGEKKDGGGAEKAEAPKKDICVGMDISNLEDMLTKSDCEVPNTKPDGIQNAETKGKLEVSVSASPTKVAPGGKTDLMVTFANKTKEPMTLNFRIDPVARFEIEAYEMPKAPPPPKEVKPPKDAKADKDAGAAPKAEPTPPPPPPPPAPLTKRVDMPAGQPPPPPKGHSAPPPAEQKVAKITLAPNGAARVRVPWEAVKMKWAPEKVRGTAVEKGYPRVPAGPLPKGKYTVKVLTPLIGVSEGSDHEVSAPRVDIEVG